MNAPIPVPAPPARLWSFRVVYLAIVSFVLLAVISVVAAESLIERYFQAAVQKAISVDPADGSIAEQIQNRVNDVVRESAWVRIGGIRVDAIVVAADNSSLYALGRTSLPPPFTDPFIEAQRLLPATAAVFVSMPLDALLPAAILVLYGAVLIQGLFLYLRAANRRELQLIEAATAARDHSAQRAVTIESELGVVRDRLSKLAPSEKAQSEAIRELQNERAALQRKLRELAEREAELRGTAQRTSELDEERQALEDLLEEAMEDLGQKETEIESLQARLKRATKSAPAPVKAKPSDALARRMRTLYKHVTLDDRALSDLVALRDESMKLRAEEVIKRLGDDPDTASIRRKVGGLPPQLTIYEVGFAGKGRIYYTREGQKYRVLAIGAKNTQKSDLEYLSRHS